MITWMQRHRKYLVITIWISTIAFIGAGFVGWGQYDYGDKAGSVAKVGKISITSEEFQRSYSNLFNQYNQLLQGKLDQKKAEEFGLQRQALRQLINQALVLNLAESYGLRVSDEEIWNVIKSDPNFFKGGSFDKGTYETVLNNQYRMSKKDFDATVKKEILIQKTLFLLASGAKPLEIKSLGNLSGVSDKISYKLLTPGTISLSSDEAGLKAFWEKNKKEFMTEPAYTIAFVRQPLMQLAPSQSDIDAYYEANRHTLKDKEGKVLPLSEAKAMVVAALNDKATEKEALRLYIDYKKGSLKPGIVPEKASFTVSTSPFDPALTKEIGSLNEQKAFLKPRKAGSDYVVIKLESFSPARVMTYEEAKTEANALYAAEQKKAKLQELAKNSYQTFSGTVSDFVTRSDGAKLAGLSAAEGSEFLSKLFGSKQKQGFVTLESGNVILYNVLEQKLLQDKTNTDVNTVAKLKGNVLDQGLIKALETRYPVEIYVEGI